MALFKSEAHNRSLILYQKTMSPKSADNFVLSFMLPISKVTTKTAISVNCYVPVSWHTLGHSQGGSLTYPMLITVFVQF